MACLSVDFQWVSSRPLYHWFTTFKAFTRVTRSPLGGERMLLLHIISEAVPGTYSSLVSGQFVGGGGGGGARLWSCSHRVINQQAVLDHDASLPCCHCPVLQ